MTPIAHRVRGAARSFPEMPKNRCFLPSSPPIAACPLQPQVGSEGQG